MGCYLPRKEGEYGENGYNTEKRSKSDTDVAYAQLTPGMTPENGTSTIEPDFNPPSPEEGSKRLNGGKKSIKEKKIKSSKKGSKSKLTRARSTSSPRRKKLKKSKSENNVTHQQQSQEQLSLDNIVEEKLEVPSSSVNSSVSNTPIISQTKEVQEDPPPVILASTTTETNHDSDTTSIDSSKGIEKIATSEEVPTSQQTPPSLTDGSTEAIPPQSMEELQRTLSENKRKDSSDSDDSIYTLSNSKKPKSSRVEENINHTNDNNNNDDMKILIPASKSTIEHQKSEEDLLAIEIKHDIPDAPEFEPSIVISPVPAMDYKLKPHIILEALNLAKTQSLKSAAKFIMATFPSTPTDLSPLEDGKTDITIPPTPRTTTSHNLDKTMLVLELANFLFENRTSLDQEQLGDFLGTSDDNLLSPEEFSIIRNEYISFFSSVYSLAGIDFDDALRWFVTKCGFRMPGEAQKIERLLDAFSEVFFSANPGVYKSSGSILCLAYSLMILNTELHDSRLGKRKRMDLNSFVKNLQGVNEGGDYDFNLLAKLYKSIKLTPMEWAGGAVTEENVIYPPGSDGTTLLGKIRVGLYYDKHKNILICEIFSCDSLPSLESEETTDPFVRIRTIHEDDKKKPKFSFKTKIKKNTSKPNYLETFQLKMSLKDIISGLHGLELSVWHKKSLKKDRFMSWVLVDISKVPRLESSVSEIPTNCINTYALQPIHIHSLGSSSIQDEKGRLKYPDGSTKTLDGSFRLLGPQVPKSLFFSTDEEDDYLPLKVASYSQSNLPPGSQLLSDGTLRQYDGSVILPTGSILRADGLLRSENGLLKKPNWFCPRPPFPNGVTQHPEIFSYHVDNKARVIEGKSDAGVSLGVLKVTIQRVVDSLNNKIIITIVEGRGLPGLNKQTESYPFVRVLVETQKNSNEESCESCHHIFPSFFPSATRQHSRVPSAFSQLFENSGVYPAGPQATEPPSQGCRDLMWNKEFLFDIVENKEKKNNIYIAHITVMNHALLEQIIGIVDIPIYAGTNTEQAFEGWFAIQPTPPSFYASSSNYKSFPLAINTPKPAGSPRHLHRHSNSLSPNSFSPTSPKTPSSPKSARMDNSSSSFLTHAPPSSSSSLTTSISEELIFMG